MRHPSGLASIVAYLEETTDPKDLKRHALIELDGKAHRDDADTLIYFSQYPDLTRLFNEAAEQAREGLAIQVQIPKKEMIGFVAECFVAENCTLVTNILSSDLIDDATDAFAEMEVLHHKSYSWVSKNRPDEKKPQVRKHTKADEKLDDLGKPDNLDKPFVVSTTGMNLESAGKSSFPKKILAMGEREREGHQDAPQNDNKPVPATTRSPRGGSGDRKSVKNKKSPADSSKIPEVKEIEDELINMGYQCVTKSFKVPLLENKKTAPLFCFRDKQKTIPRNYHILKADAADPGEWSFYFVWLDPQNIDGSVRRKEMLVASAEVKDMEKMANLIYQELLHQAEHGNRKWFKDEDTEFRFITFRYSDKFKKDLAGTILFETKKL